MDEEKAREIFGVFKKFFDVEGISEIDRWHLLMSMTMTCNKGATIGYIKDLIRKEKRFK